MIPDRPARHMLVEIADHLEPDRVPPGALAAVAGAGMHANVAQRREQPDPIRRGVDVRGGAPALAGVEALHPAHRAQPLPLLGGRPVSMVQHQPSRLEVAPLVTVEICRPVGRRQAGADHWWAAGGLIILCHWKTFLEHMVAGPPHVY